MLLLRGGEIFAKIADRSYTLTEQKVQSDRGAMWREPPPAFQTLAKEMSKIYAQRFLRLG